MTRPIKDPPRDLVRRVAEGPPMTVGAVVEALDLPARTGQDRLRSIMRRAGYLDWEPVMPDPFERSQEAWSRLRAIHSQSPLLCAVADVAIEQRYTQVALAEAAGVSPHTLQNLTRGRNATSTLILQKLMAALGTKEVLERALDLAEEQDAGHKAEL